MTLKRYVKHYANWLVDGRYHLLTIDAYLATFLYCTKALTFYPSIVALLMVLAGLAIILAQQILDANEYTNHSPNTFCNWLKLVLIRKKAVSAHISVASCQATAVFLAPVISVEWSTEQKVEFLLSQVTALVPAINNANNRIDVVSSALSDTEQRLQKTISTLTASIDKVIAGHVVGSYDLNLFGINITVCGTIIQFFADKTIT